MSLNETPLANRLHIAIFGKRNSGKSSLINAITNQNIALVSDVAGTTTDPVYKSMELLPIGPVVIIDTAGIDDEGELGQLRIERTMKVLNKTELAVVLIEAESGVTNFEQDLISKLKEKSIPYLVVLNKIDLMTDPQESIQKLEKEVGQKIVPVSAATGQGISELKRQIILKVPEDFDNAKIVGDLLKPGDLVVLVVPIDKAAPKGRLILPQQQTIRDIIESDAIAVVTKEHELKETLRNLGKKPAMVITDSQAFLKVDADTPRDIPLTSFSILFARYKGELIEMIKGIKAIENLKSSSKVLIVEGCTHHRQSDDIGTVKIPRWLKQKVGADLQFEWASGVFFPDDISKYDLVVHCGACMLNEKEMKYRIHCCKEKGVPIVNYGMLIAYVHGIFERALEPFPIAKVILDE